MSDQKLDAQKRRTIKMFGAVPLMSVPVLGAAAGVPGAHRLDELKLPAAKPRTSMAVEIQIINSSVVPENSVLIRNTTDEELLITRFMPGHIIFNSQHMDLNAAIGETALVLSPEQSKAYLYDIAPANEFRHVEFVWADHAVESLSEHTSVVTLGAFMADTDAIVYANTKQYIPS